MHAYVRLLSAVAATASLGVTSAGAADTWQYRGVARFTLPDGGYRSQGAVWDGKHWFFSWHYGLERAGADFHTMQRNSNLWKKSGIPAEIAAHGGNHIGDIDQFDGKLYVPIEDAPDYHRPVIAVFDAASLAWTGVAFPLQAAYLSRGVPWVVVDGPGNLTCTAEWESATRLNVHRLSDFGSLGYLQLQKPVDRLQGAKVSGAYLYAASDNASKSIYRLSRSDGTVEEILQLGSYHDLHDGQEHEVEGLGVVEDASGNHLHVLLRHGSLQRQFSAAMLFLHFERLAQ